MDENPASIHAPRGMLAAAGLMFMMGAFMIVRRGVEDKDAKDRIHP